MDFMICLGLRTSQAMLNELGTQCHLSLPQVCCAPVFNQGNLVSHLLQPFKSFKVSQLLPVKLLSSGLPLLEGSSKYSAVKIEVVMGNGINQIILMDGMELRRD